MATRGRPVRPRGSRRARNDGERGASRNAAPHSRRYSLRMESKMLHGSKRLMAPRFGRPM